MTKSRRRPSNSTSTFAGSGQDPEPRRDRRREDAFPPAPFRQVQTRQDPRLTTRARAALQELLDESPQRVGRLDGRETAPPGDGDDPALLGHHDAERVAPLGESERRGVPRPAFPQLIELRRERQMHAEARHLAAADHDRAVVSRRLRVEEAPQERFAHASAQVVPPVEESIDRLPTGEHEERADPRVREREAQRTELIENIVTRSRRRAAHQPERKTFEEATQIVLEDDDQDERGDRDEALEQRRREPEVEQRSQPEQGTHDRHPAEGHPHARLADPRDRDPAEHRDDHHVQHVDEAESCLRRIGHSSRVHHHSTDPAPAAGWSVRFSRRADIAGQREGFGPETPTGGCRPRPAIDQSGVAQIPSPIDRGGARATQRIPFGLSA